MDIENEKVDIQDEKVDIESVLSEKGSDFSVKTTIHIHRLFEKFGFDEVFGRSAVMELLELKGSGASKLLSNLVQADIIEPVSGHGKGKYKFKKQCISYLKFYKIFLEIVDTACRQSDVLFSAEEKREKEQNRIVYTFHNEKQNKDVYMVALRDESKLIGYYEKHEYRNSEIMKP